MAITSFITHSSLLIPPTRSSSKLCVRRPTPLVSMTSSNDNKKDDDVNFRGKDDSSSGESQNDEGTVSFGRFQEFTPSSGNARTQDNLVREVLWQALRLSTSESMDSTIQSQLDATSETISDMYTKSERDIVERNERLAMQTSLPNISKWNQQLIAGNKTSKQHQMEILKELALVDALLKRNMRKKKIADGQRRRRQRISHNRKTSVLDLDASSKDVARRASKSTAISSASQLLFTIVVCSVGIQSFESITSREGGAARLANYAAFSSFLILLLSYMSALRGAMRQAQEDLQRQTDSFRRKDPSKRS